MKIELKKLTVKELSKDYVDNNEEGVKGYGGKLDIRPQYQREFIYKEKQRDAVIDTINNNFPLNVMYWAVRDDGSFEIIDGQQRTISICQYVTGVFSFDSKYFHNLQDDEQNQIYDYELTVYLCSGTDSEKLKWFETINIAGEKLTQQELRNAVYSGSWVSDAKRYFSKTGCVAYSIASDYVSGSAIRQEYLETAIKWISKDNINDYMAKNQHKQNANILWNYFQSVINWVETTFKVKRKYMKSVDWGSLYNEYKDMQLDTDKIELETEKLILDDDATQKSGIYPYILTRDEKCLSIRAFTENMKHKVYEKQHGKCVKCNEHFELSEMEADHITPWHEGGKTNEDNCQLLCKNDNRRKSGK
ncbi:MAG: HNH endonuclease family protein [Nitrosotalea sp.]